MQPTNPILSALQSIQQPTSQPQNTSDYHMYMSNWMHNQINSGAWSKMSGKDIVNSFQQQRGAINNILSQKANQAASQFQQSPQPPQIMGNQLPQQMNF
jgi:hypothetical protein